MDAAEEVLSSMPDHAGALELRGQSLLDRAMDNVENPDPALLDAAAANFRAAVTTSPDRASAWERLSSVLLTLGRVEESEAAARRALETDAYLEEASDVLYRLFMANLDLGKETDALSWCSEGAEQYPEAVEFIHCRLRFMAHADSVTPDTTLARELYHRLQDKLGGEDSEQKPYFSMHNRLLMAAVFARAGFPAEADSQIEQVRSFAAQRGLDRRYEFELSWVQLRLGRQAQAIQSVRALLESHPEYLPLVVSSRQFRSISDEPEFQDLISSVSGG